MKPPCDCECYCKSDYYINLWKNMEEVKVGDIVKGTDFALSGRIDLIPMTKSFNDHCIGKELPYQARKCVYRRKD